MVDWKRAVALWRDEAEHGTRAYLGYIQTACRRIVVLCDQLARALAVSAGRGATIRRLLVELESEQATRAAWVWRYNALRWERDMLRSRVEVLENQLF